MTTSTRVEDAKLREMMASCVSTEKEVWLIEEADQGGMVGGYPRWLGARGFGYTAMSPMDARHFRSHSEAETSPEWHRVNDNRDYSIVSYKWTEKPSVPDPDSIRSILSELLELRDAVKGVLEHRVGALPERGWLKDTDASRAAIDKLARSLSQGAGHEQ